MDGSLENFRVSELLRTTLKNMNMTWPPLEPEVDPDEVRRRLA